MRIHSIVLLSVACLSALAGGLRAEVAVSLQPSFPAPSFVGDTVVWVATVSDSAPGTLWCRFRVRPPGGVFQTVIDYGPQTSFQWTPAEREGRFEVEVSARNRATGEERRTSEFYEVLSRVRDGPAPVISQTLHPLVFLYSAPECAPNGQMRVEFGSERGDRIATPAKPCVAGRSMNFLLAGMRSDAEYSVRHIVETRRRRAGTFPQPESVALCIHILRLSVDDPARRPRRLSLCFCRALPSVGARWPPISKGICCGSIPAN